MKHFLSLTFLLGLTLSSYAVTLNSHYPQNYVVQKGDTLYSIAGKYLQKPWEWRELWDANPKIRTPHKLYPGTVLTLVYVDGKPRLKRKRYGNYKLSPHSRPRPASDPIPAIPLSDIGPFLDKSIILDEDALLCAPYVVSFSGERLLGGDNNQGYVQDLTPTLQKNPKLDYAVFRPTGTYKAKDNPKKIIGYKATYIADAQLVKQGQPATVVFNSITQGVRIKDRLFPSAGPAFPFYFEPQAPLVKVEGEIIDVVNAIVQVAKDQVIVLNLGKKDQLAEGDILAIYKPNKLIRDPLKAKEEFIELPRERLGEAMVFKTFTHTSYALVLQSRRAVNLHDIVTNP